MAVVQISKIQVRRGQKNQGTGIPQLASGEFGWAVDSQELFIGNGAVSEGAPAVGNTQILTTNADIFALADEYSYNKDLGYIRTGLTDNTKRKLQDKLDDFVSAADFGMTGVSTQDVTELLQNALDQLYINDASKGTESSRVTLYFPAGVYSVSNTIYLPPSARLVGHGIDNTVIRNTGSQSAVFTTVNLDSEPGTYADHSTTTSVNQNSDLVIENLTVQTFETNNVFVLNSTKDSKFSNVKIKGAWTSEDSIDTFNSAFVLNNLSASVQTKNNVFYNCFVENMSYAVYSDWDTNFNEWRDCTFYNLGLGFAFGLGVTSLDSSPSSGINTGAEHNVIDSCHFKDISRHALYFKYGSHNSSKNNKFEFVGNNHGADYSSAFPVIQFDGKQNTSKNDWFSRVENLSADMGNVGAEYNPEIKGSINHTGDNYAYTTIQQSSVYSTKLRFAAEASTVSQQFKITYFLNSLSYSMTRSGSLLLTVNSNNGTVKISDEYDYNGDSDKETDILFGATLTSINSVAHINISVKSTMPADDNTELKYSIELLK